MLSQKNTGFELKTNFSCGEPNVYVHSVWDMTVLMVLQQAVLVRQLQDQHYHQYMQQLIQQRSTKVAELSELEDRREEDVEEHRQILGNGSLHHSQPDSEDDDDEGRLTSGIHHVDWN